jgi:hypothetical protein
MLRALVMPSFQKEYVVGIRAKNKAVEAFILEPSSSIWDTELVRLRENGEIKELTREGNAFKEVPPKKSAALKKLKERTPADYRTIKASRFARPIPGELAGEMTAIWRTMLLDVRHPPEGAFEDVMDGDTYHFSAWIWGRGAISGHAHEPDPESKTGRLASLADALGDYARGKADLTLLKQEVEQAAKAIDP